MMPNLRIGLPEPAGKNYLYDYKLPGQDKPRLEKTVNVDCVPFIRAVRVLCKPLPE